MIREQIQKSRKIDPNFPWHHRGYLPHFDGKDELQFITFRLAESLPRNILQKLKLRAERKQITGIEYHREVERFLDNSFGPTFLSIPEVATTIEENLSKHDGTKYELLHWVIMPNHVHLLIRLLATHSLSSVIHSIKSYTANQCNQVLGRSGAFWSSDYYDRYIRDEEHFENTVRYIHQNPVKARLCSRPGGWPFSCARYHE